MWSTRVRSVVNHFVKMDSSCNLYAYSRFVLPFSILWNTFSIRERAFLALGAVFRNSLFFQESFMVQVILVLWLNPSGLVYFVLCRRRLLREWFKYLTKIILSVCAWRKKKIALIQQSAKSLWSRIRWKSHVMYDQTANYFNSSFVWWLHGAA